MRFVRVPCGLRELGKSPLRELQEELLPQSQEPRTAPLRVSDAPVERPGPGVSSRSSSPQVRKPLEASCLACLKVSLRS